VADLPVQPIGSSGEQTDGGNPIAAPRSMRLTLPLRFRVKSVVRVRSSHGRLP
jgi:hypothetical protein